MAIFNSIIKMNKGTSRTEYGILNYWGYKTPTGLIRARVYSPGLNDLSLIEVKHYDQAVLQSSWRKTLDWYTATTISSSYIKVTDSVKGLDAATVIAEVNALLEIYNDESEKHVGRKVVRTEEFKKQDTYNNNDDQLNPYVVGRIEVSFDTDTVMSTELFMKKEGYSSPRKFTVNDVVDFAVDNGRAAVLEQIKNYRDSLKVSEEFLNQLEDNLNDDVKATVPYYGSSATGALDTSLMTKLITSINNLIPDPVVEPVEVP